MSQTPSAWRAGYNSFYRGGNPANFQPYLAGSSNSLDWLEGWAKAKHADDIKIAEADEVEKFARLYNLAKDRGLIS